MFYANYIRERMKALPKVEELEGNPISIENSLKRPFRKISVLGESTQYGTPAPDAPIDIVSVENPVLRVTGNNLFNIDVIPSIGLTNNGDGTLTLPSVSNTTAKNLSDVCPSVRVGDRIAFYMENTGSGRQVYFLNDRYVSYGIYFTVTETDLTSRLFFVGNSTAAGGGSATVSNIRVVYEGCPTDYTPYIEPQEVVLNGVTLRGIDAYRDEVVVDSVKKTVKLIERCYEITLTDESDFSRYSTGKGFMFQNALKDVSMRKQGLVSNGASLGAIYTQGYWLGVGNKAVYWIYSPFFDETLEDYGVANVKEYLTQNPIKIVTYYNEPIETDITNTQAGKALLALHTNRGNTVISLYSASKQGEIKVKYIRK